MNENPTLNPTKKNRNGPGEVSFPQIDKFPEELQRAVKVGAAKKGRSIKDFVVEALRYALEHDHVVREKAVVNLENESVKTEVRSDTRENAQGGPRETRRRKAGTKT